tara:strand:+ start:7118 stop:7489 length:372 start_codon:yes stop_codon:yes gene_type:complete
LLTSAKDIQFPALQASSEVLVSIVKVKDMLSSAATTGDKDILEEATNVANEVREKLAQLATIDKTLGEEIKEVIKDFKDYFEIAYGVSESMVNGTADFAKLGNLSQKMNIEFENATDRLEKFK